MKGLKRVDTVIKLKTPNKKAAEPCSPVEALQLYRRMHRKSARLDSFAVLSALKACSHLRDNLPLTRHLHAHLLKLGFATHLYVATCLLSVYSPTIFRDARLLFDEMPTRSAVTWNIMITGYSKQGDVSAARLMFDTMPHRVSSSWSAMIAAYIDNSLWHHGISLFRLMMTGSRSLRPDQLTLGPILAGCGRLSSVGLALGKSMHAFAVKNKWELNVELGSCLVDMYAKCGVLENARLVFDTMKQRNVVAWTALIHGAAQHGQGREALRVFEKMREAGVKPNDVTFTGVLAACVQAGLVEEGRGYFATIGRPRIQHYGCMVDLYGKAGLVREAYRVIETMPYEANAVVWGSFLSACKLHKQLDMVDEAIDEVKRVMSPDNDGGLYSLISQLYLLCGRASEAQAIRDLNVRKIRASTFITTGN
ncbi:pentatricopeptide repeat-containing protein At5g66520-like [Salvia miltiorrhiza]|uniref:pentatricopeptide repeat-containing protein At5g66520-like n=1 Tax=Salvia miltiorrhiza TaxID=226208 RepID=UPI0025ACB9DE|nr:pentatricopeptide repeat-containing protein At5g66520-like [Salvia miltiorrhiza]